MKEAMRLKAQIKAMSLQVRIPANAVLQICIRILASRKCL